MQDWLKDVDGPAVLVTVAKAEGSVPREAGAKMLVTRSGQYDTIGGGHLEHKAIARASELMNTFAERGSAGKEVFTSALVERYPLGPGLGQCCGGVVWLLFEPVGPQLAAALDSLRDAANGADAWRIAAIDGEAECIVAGAGEHPLAHGSEARIVVDEAGRRWLVDPCLAPRAHLVLFGAGHVGAAIVRALAELPCKVTWVDERDAQFPASVPANVTIEATDTPEAVVEQAPPGASYLVMTHSHALDQRLCEAILSRDQVGWFGLIGSKTKRAQFTSRLEAKGMSAATMVCPVGVPGIIGKEPAVIAASVAAQLLIVWESQAKA